MKILIVFLCCITAQLVSQSSGPQFYKSGVMNGNNIKTVFGNWGVIGQPVDFRPRGAWLKESNGYIGDLSIVIGLELPIKDYTGDGKPDTVHSVITTPVSRPASLFDTDDWSGGGKHYTFMPVEGFADPSQTSVAMSDKPSTWPALWGGSWKGVRGNGEIAADLEAYYQMDDQNDERFYSAANNPQGIQFRADTANLARKGHGIRVDVRYLQFKHPLYNDILFRVYDVRNESSFDYKKVVVGSVGGTLIGVTGTQLFNEYDDDYSILFKSENTVITGDFNDTLTRNPFWRGRVGKVAEAFLVSAGNGAVGGYRYFTPSNDIPLGSDKELWQQLTPGYYQVPANIVNDTTVLNGGDGDYLFGSQYFSLPSKGTKRIVSAIAYDYTAAGIFQRMKLGKVLANNDFDLEKILSQLLLPQFFTPQTLSGTTTLQWPVNNAAGTVEICFSPDDGATWRTIADSLPDNGSHQLNTTQIPDCAFGILRIFYKGPIGAYSSVRQSGAYITIDNAGNGYPFIKITSSFADTMVVSAALFPLRILVGDPDNASLTASVYYSLGREFVKSMDMTIASSAEEEEIILPLSQMPNGDRFRLKIVVSDGATIWSDSTLVFTKATLRNTISPSNIFPVSIRTQAQISFGVVDKMQTTSDSYTVSFVDTAHATPKTVSVFNKTKNTTVLNTGFINHSESPIFDGLRLTIHDIETKYDTAYWNRADSSCPTVRLTAINDLDINNNILHGYRSPEDYKILFGVKGETIDMQPYYGFSTPPESTTMVIRTANTNLPVDFFLFSVPPHTYYFTLVENVMGKKRLTWFLEIQSDQFTQGVPKNGDTIICKTKKGISFYDSLQISNVALSVPSANTTPNHYVLHQNYPNPFNPATSVEYSLGFPGIVSLTVYDMLGRELKTIVNEYRTAGDHVAVFDASEFASGIYFYRLKSGAFVETKKMLLLR